MPPDVLSRRDGLMTSSGLPRSRDILSFIVSSPETSRTQGLQGLQGLPCPNPNLYRRKRHLTHVPLVSSPMTVLDSVVPGATETVRMEGGVGITIPAGVAISAPDGRVPPTSIGPITVKDSAEVVEDDSTFVVLQVVNCFPTSIFFSKPLLLEFAVEKYSAGKRPTEFVHDRILQDYQVWAGDLFIISMN